MPELDGQHYKYNKAGYAAYVKALKKKRAKKDGDNHSEDLGDTRG